MIQQKSSISRRLFLKSSILAGGGLILSFSWLRSFATEAEAITEAINLYAVALRSNKLLQYDSANKKITNVPEANKYLSREYRRGWDPASI